MAYDAIATRYAEAAFDAAKEQHQLDQTLEQLLAVGHLISEHADLRQLIRNPDVEPQEKVGVLDRVLGGSWSPLVRSFVRMVVGFGRAEDLPQIAEALQERVDEEQGRTRVVVRSAYPLPAQALDRVRAHLERRERKQIELTTESAPELLGGLQLVLGHRVIDASVRRQLSDLKQRLSAVRVH